MEALQKSLKASFVLSVRLVLVLLWLRASLMAAKPDGVRVGVILDLNSTFGSKVNHSLTFAIEDYYSSKNLPAKIELIVQSIPRNDVVAAERAAYDLIKNRTVRAILGPQNSEQARFIVELGKKYQVPVIWFPITGPSLLPPPSPSSDQGLNCLQFRAIADVIEALGWQSIVPIYEDTEYGNQLIPCLANVLKDMGIRMANVTAIDSNSTDDEIDDILLELKKMRTRVFLVHMSMDFGAKFIFSAQEQDMMDQEYAWILTQELSSLTDPRVNITRKLYYTQTKYRNFTDPVALKRYMQGALGVRPMDLVSKKTPMRRGREKNFADRFRTTLTIYGWWAYHTIEVLAEVVEKQGANDGIKLRNEEIIQVAANLKSSRSSGVNFNLRDGQLHQLELEVYNVIADRERIIGCWSPENGLDQNCSKVAKTSGQYPLKDPLWPGDTLDKPPKLRIGLPTTNSFPEFVNYAYNFSKLRIDSGGFAINVFLKAVQVLPFPLNNYEFVPLPNTSMAFGDLLCDQMLKVKDLDAIIGDITIVERRTKCVDFTLPYLDSRVAMVVRVKKASTSKAILLKPFNLLLWLILGGIFVVATIIIIILERSRTTETSERKKTEEFYYNPFLVYKIDAMENFKSRAAGWMVIVTSFLFILVVQVYTASLISILTQGKMRVPSFQDEKELIKNSSRSVGYQDGSWVRELLIEQIRFKPHQLKALRRREEYNDALSNGTIDAIFDETPYLTLFLSQYKSQFMMTGPINKTGGFAFAFPKKSRLVSHFSSAILKVIQDVESYRLLIAKSSLPTSIEDLEFEDQSDIETSSLSIANFGGLYPVLSSVVALSLGLSIINPSVIRRSLNPLPVIRRLLEKLPTLKQRATGWLRNKKQHFKLAKA